jgi:hypothetical protein
MRRASAAVLFLLFASACGGGGGGGATTPSSASLSVVDGITGSALAASSSRPGETVTITNAGYLRRDTIVPRDGRISLWPITVDEPYVQTLVYSETALRNRLIRWPGTSVTVPRDFPADVIELVRPWVTLVPSDSPAVTVVVDPSNPNFARFGPDIIGLALSQVSDTDAHMISSQLVFRSDDALRRPGSLPHEFGHALGLHHSPRTADLMFESTARTTTVFSADERVLLTMMYAHRRPGQVAPDNDQSLGQAGSGTVRLVAH